METGQAHRTGWGPRLASHFMLSSVSPYGHSRRTPDELAAMRWQNGEYELLALELGNRVLEHVVLVDFDAMDLPTEIDFMSEQTYRQYVQDGAR